MTTFRDLPNPSGADIEAFVNQRLQVVLQQAIAGASSASFKAEDYDIRIDPGNHFPGEGYEFVAAVPFANNVYIMWRILRTTLTQRGQTAIMARESQKK